MFNFFYTRGLSNHSWKIISFYFLLLSGCLPYQLLSSNCVLLPCLVEDIEGLALFEKTYYAHEKTYYAQEVKEFLEVNEERESSQIVSEFEKELSCVEDSQVFEFEKELSCVEDSQPNYVLEQKLSDIFIKENNPFQDAYQMGAKGKESSSYQIQKDNSLSVGQLQSVDLSFKEDKEETDLFDYESAYKVESETALLDWCKKAALLEKALIVVTDNPEKYFKGLSIEGRKFLEKRCCILQCPALIISQTCKLDSSFPITGIMILSQFNENINGIYIDWMMIYPKQKLFINIMNSEIDLSFFFHLLKNHKK